jgi:hypothetical protein
MALIPAAALKMLSGCNRARVNKAFAAAAAADATAQLATPAQGGTRPNQRQGRGAGIAGRAPTWKLIVSLAL